MLRYRDYFPLAADREARSGGGPDHRLSDLLPVGILVTDRDGKCIHSNLAYQKICGWNNDELMGSHWSAVVHPGDHARVIRQWDEAVLGQTPFLSEVRLKHANGKTVWVRRKAVPVSSRRPDRGYVHTVEDIGIYKAEQRAINDAESQLFEEKERAHAALESVTDAVVMTDIGGRVSYMNLVAETLTGYSRHEAVGRPLTEIFSLVDPETQDPLDDLVWRVIRSGRAIGMEANAVLVSRDGSEHAIEESANPLHNRYGAVVGSVIVFHELCFSREAMSRMAYLAQHDPLTGLHNRSAFYERFEQAQAMAQRHGKQMGLLFIDLDNFKGINDSLGHESGDMILTALAGKLKSCVRSADTVCRYGGDEFVVLLGEIAEASHAHAVADKIRESAAEPMVIAGREVSLQLSIGVSVYPEDGEIVEDLVKTADSAMYRLKKTKKPLVLRGRLLHGSHPPLGLI